MDLEFNNLIDAVNHAIKKHPGNKSPAATPWWFNLNKRKALLDAVQEAPAVHKIETLKRMNADVKNLEKFFSTQNNPELDRKLQSLTTAINSLIQKCEKTNSVSPSDKKTHKKKT